MRLLHAFLVSVMAAAVTGCGAAPYQEPSAPLSVPSTYSASGSGFSSSVPSGISFPSRDATASDLVVRPDLVCVPFVLRVQLEDPKEGIKQLEAAARDVGARFSAATPGAVVKMLGSTTSNISYPVNNSRFMVMVDGVVEVSLPSDADFWVRTRLMVALSEASRPAPPAKPDGDKETKPAVESAFSLPVLKVRDPEAHRAELIKRWVERTRAFARGAESNGATLELVDCAPPAGITQRAISVEEVGLSLAVTCRLDVIRRGP